MIAAGVEQTYRLRLVEADQKCVSEQSERQTQCDQQISKLRQQMQNLQDEFNEQRALNQEQEMQMKEKDSQLQQQIQKEQSQLKQCEQQQQELNQKLALLDSKVQSQKVNQGQFTGQSEHVNLMQLPKGEQPNDRHRLSLHSTQSYESLQQGRLAAGQQGQYQKPQLPDEKAYNVMEDESSLQGRQQAGRHQTKVKVSAVSCDSFQVS